jgi:uncharacterized membrane protein
MNRYVTTGFVLVLAVFAATLALYPQLPERVPTRWEDSGEIRYGPKSRVFILPAVMAGIVLAFGLGLPWLSPKRFEVHTFGSTYYFIMLAILALTAWFHAVMLRAAWPGAADPPRALAAGVFVFLMLFGNVLGKVRRNFWIGVRTPWTLADERVWNATHRLAGWVFVLTGLLGLVAALAGLDLRIGLTLLVASAAAVIVYSLVYYKRLERRGEL